MRQDSFRQDQPYPRYPPGFTYDSEESSFFYKSHVSEHSIDEREKKEKFMRATPRIEPDFGTVPEPDQVIAHMKDDIDELKSVMQDRTNELRATQKYLQRFETSIMALMTKQFDAVYKRVEYHVAELKDLLYQRMNLVSARLVN